MANDERAAMEAELPKGVASAARTHANRRNSPAPALPPGVSLELLPWSPERWCLEATTRNADRRKQIAACDVPTGAHDEALACMGAIDTIRSKAAEWRDTVPNKYRLACDPKVREWIKAQLGVLAYLDDVNRRLRPVPVVEPPAGKPKKD